MRILSWNVEHFSGTAGGSRADRISRVCDFVLEADPDVFAIMEVTGARVFEAFTRRLSGYSFSITEGPQSQETLVGIRAGLRSFVTQRSEFKRNNPNLRPGMLVTITDNRGRNLPILFNHLKSLPDPEGFGLRNAMIENANGLWRAVRDSEAAAGVAEVPFLLVGDLNLMGLELAFSDSDIPASEEIARVVRRFARTGLRHLRKTHPATWSKGSASSLAASDLDHVFAARHMRFADMGAGAEVRVAGWPELPPGPQQDDWIARYSDHAALIFEVAGD